LQLSFDAVLAAAKTTHRLAIPRPIFSLSRLLHTAPHHFLKDLEVLFCHPYFMNLEAVTPMHHLMIMVSSVASGSRK